jgi:hypothetical protein
MKQLIEPWTERVPNSNTVREVGHNAYASPARAWRERAGLHPTTWKKVTIAQRHQCLDSNNHEQTQSLQISMA